MQIRDIIDSNDNQNLEILAQKIACCGATLSGTRPYLSDVSWKFRAQIHNPDCKSPHFFFTVLAANIQWSDLHQHMPVNPEALPENKQEAYCIRVANLNDNPAIAAYYFQKCWEISIKSWLSFS